MLHLSQSERDDVRRALEKVRRLAHETQAMIARSLQSVAVAQPKPDGETPDRHP